MVDKPKKVLFKIPSEDEIKKATPPPAELEPKVPENLPIAEPAPIAEVDGAKSKAERKIKAAEAKAKRAGPGPKPSKVKRKLTRAEKEERKAKRLEKQRKLRIDLVDGITVGGRAMAKTVTSRRLTRDRRREVLDRRRSMKVSVGGEEAEISESSKYMLDMLIKD